MKTIKIIDLYNLIANEDFDKLPKKVKYEDDIYYWHEKDLDYFTDDKHNFKVYLFNNHTNFILNDEVEILEDEKKIPEKIPLNYADDRKPEEVYEYLRCSYNQLLDYLKSKGD